MRRPERAVCAYWKTTLTASVKLFVFPMSMYQHWKLYVSPGCTATKAEDWERASGKVIMTA